MVTDNVIDTRYSTDTSYTITKPGKYTLIALRGPLYDAGYTIKHNFNTVATYSAVGFSKAEGIEAITSEITCYSGDTISIENLRNSTDVTKNNVARVLLFKESEPSAGEIEIVPLVPTLTSNTGSDGGSVIVSSIFDNNYDGYKASIRAFAPC